MKRSVVMVMSLASLLSMSVFSTELLWVNQARVTQVIDNAGLMSLEVNDEKLVNGCELWSADGQIQAALNQATASNELVSLRYVGTGEHRCQVNLVMSANR